MYLIAKELVSFFPVCFRAWAASPPWRSFHFISSSSGLLGSEWKQKSVMCVREFILIPLLHPTETDLIIISGPTLEWRERMVKGGLQRLAGCQQWAGLQDQQWHQSCLSSSAAMAGTHGLTPGWAVSGWKAGPGLTGELQPNPVPDTQTDNKEMLVGRWAQETPAPKKRWKRTVGPNDQLVQSCKGAASLWIKLRGVLWGLQCLGRQKGQMRKVR